MDKLTSVNFRQELNNRERWKPVSLKEVEYYVCIPYFRTQISTGLVGTEFMADAFGNIFKPSQLPIDLSFYFIDGTPFKDENIAKRVNEFGQLDWTYIKGIPNPNPLVHTFAFFVPAELGELEFNNYIWNGEEESYHYKKERINGGGKGKGCFLISNSMTDTLNLEYLKCISDKEFMLLYDLRAFPNLFTDVRESMDLFRPTLDLMIKKEAIDGSEVDKAVCHKFCDYVAYLRNKIKGVQEEYRVKHYSMSKMSSSAGGFIKAKSCIKFGDGEMFDIQYIIAPISKKLFSFNKAPMMIKGFNIRTPKKCLSFKAKDDKENLFMLLEDVMSQVVKEE